LEIDMPSASLRPLIAGNWKMNGLKASLSELRLMLQEAPSLSKTVDLLICPPATLVCAFAEAARGNGLSTGGQDCHVAASGAHTGDISAEMLADLGASHVIAGHSERRADHGESDSIVRAKAAAIARAGLVSIICVGETEAERDAGRTLDVVGSQLSGSIPTDADPSRIVIAYEPVWAIGTGRTPTLADVALVHAALRRALADRFGAAGETVRILYGGSVKPSNARELLGVDHVNGALIGGASLKASDFLGIAKSA
jgi:triosephosphate isomerase